MTAETGVIPIFQDMGNFAYQNVVRLPLIPYFDYVNFLNSELQKMQGLAPTIENTSGIVTTHVGNRVSVYLEDKETNIVYKVSKTKKSVWVEFFMAQHEKAQLLMQAQ